MYNVLENILCVLEKNVYFFAAVWNVLYVHLIYSVIQVCFLLIFCLDDVFNVKCRVLMSPTTIVLLSLSLFSSINICLKYLGAPVLGAYVFTIVVYS